MAKYKVNEKYIDNTNAETLIRAVCAYLNTEKYVDKEVVFSLIGIEGVDEPDTTEGEKDADN